jgi:hypothetical protein
VIKFIDILNEAKQVGDLYHFTYLGRLPVILKSNILKALRTYGDKDNTRYISFTRNKNLFLNPSRIAGDFESALVIDGDKLSNNYKIESFSDPKSKKNEYEERVVINNPKELGISNIKNYVKKIIIMGDKVDSEELESTKLQLQKLTNVDIEIIYKKKYPLKITKDIKTQQDALKKRT